MWRFSWLFFLLTFVCLLICFSYSFLLSYYKLGVENWRTNLLAFPVRYIWRLEIFKQLKFPVEKKSVSSITCDVAFFRIFSALSLTISQYFLNPTIPTLAFAIQNAKFVTRCGWISSSYRISGSFTRLREFKKCNIVKELNVIIIIEKFKRKAKKNN